MNKWIPIRKGEKGYSAGDFKCSSCLCPNPCYRLTMFCPNCGAEMQEVNEYTCAISKRACPFNDDFWELGYARDGAEAGCPIESYENNNRMGDDGIPIIDDWCKHLIPVESWD